MNATSSSQWNTVNTDGFDSWNSQDIVLKNWVVTCGDVSPPPTLHQRLLFNIPRIAFPSKATARTCTSRTLHATNPALWSSVAWVTQRTFLRQSTTSCLKISQQFIAPTLRGSRRTQAKAMSRTSLSATSASKMSTSRSTSLRAFTHIRTAIHLASRYQM